MLSKGTRYWNLCILGHLPSHKFIVWSDSCSENILFPTIRSLFQIDGIIKWQNNKVRLYNHDIVISLTSEISNDKWIEMNWWIELKIWMNWIELNWNFVLRKWIELNWIEKNLKWIWIELNWKKWIDEQLWFRCSQWRYLNIFHCSQGAWRCLVTTNFATQCLYSHGILLLFGAFIHQPKGLKLVGLTLKVGAYDCYTVLDIWVLCLMHKSKWLPQIL